jgi:Domain of unknown function (DUF4189)
MSLCVDSGTAVSSALCSVVATFQNQCVAVAIDPQVGTPGFGWAVADTEEAAGDEALSNCRQTAVDRRQVQLAELAAKSSIATVMGRQSRIWIAVIRRRR